MVPYIKSPEFFSNFSIHTSTFKGVPNGSVMFRYRVSIHHPLGFKDSTPTGRCWYLLVESHYKVACLVLVWGVGNWQSMGKIPIMGPNGTEIMYLHEWCVSRSESVDGATPTAKRCVLRRGNDKARLVGVVPSILSRWYKFMGSMAW